MSRPKVYAGQRRAPVDWFVVAISIIVAVSAGAIGVIIALLTR